MKDYFAPPPPKPLDYAGFVAELEELLKITLGDGSLKWDADDIGFRKWKAALVDLLARIRSAGYADIRCQVEVRRFKYYGPGDRKYELKVFNQAVDDTNIELQLIIENFKKHGDPKANVREVKTAFEADAAPVAAALTVPDKITIPWLWHNLSWSVIASGIGLLVVFFGAGMTFGGTKAGQKVVDWFTPAAPVPSSVAPAVKK